MQPLESREMEVAEGCLRGLSLFSGPREPAGSFKEDTEELIVRMPLMEEDEEVPGRELFIDSFIDLIYRTVKYEYSIKRMIM